MSFKCKTNQQQQHTHTRVKRKLFWIPLMHLAKKLVLFISNTTSWNSLPSRKFYLKCYWKSVTIFKHSRTTIYSLSFAKVRVLTEVLLLFVAKARIANNISYGRKTGEYHHPFSCELPASLLFATNVIRTHLYLYMSSLCFHHPLTVGKLKQAFVFLCLLTVLIWISHNNRQISTHRLSNAFAFNFTRDKRNFPVIEIWKRHEAE